MRAEEERARAQTSKVCARVCACPCRRPHAHMFTRAKVDGGRTVHRRRMYTCMRPKHAPTRVRPLRPPPISRPYECLPDIVRFAFFFLKPITYTSPFTACPGRRVKASAAKELRLHVFFRPRGSRSAPACATPYVASSHSSRVPHASQVRLACPPPSNFRFRRSKQPAVALSRFLRNRRSSNLSILTRPLNSL